MKTYTKQIFKLLACLLLPMCVHAQAVQVLPPQQTQVPQRASAHEHLRAGEKAYKRGDYAAAELEYRRAADREPSYKAYYNLGLTLTRLERPEEAAEAFERAERFATDDAERADANYNAGTACFDAEDLQESVRQYVEALQADPSDVEAKENLTQVLKRLRLQQPPPPQEQEQEQEQEQSENEQDQEEQNEQEQEQQPSEGEQEEPEDGEQDASEEGEQEEQAPAPGEPTDEELDRQEAERLLNYARDQERKTQEKLKLDEGSTQRPLKDW